MALPLTITLPLLRCRYRRSLGEQRRETAPCSLGPFNITVPDGWHGYRHLDDQGYEHEIHVLRSNPTGIDAAQPKLHPLFSNLKAWLPGTYDGVAARYLWSKLREYVYRFDWRRYGE